MKFKAVIAALAVFSSCALLTSRPVEVHAQATQLPLAKQCFQATAGINGMVGVLGTPTGGSGYVNGSYGGVALTGGSGLNATANITVSGGLVTAVTVLNPGTEYVVGDVLSASPSQLGGSGGGFSVSVFSTSINSAVAGGSVAYYIPGTLNVKQTWQDAGETILNSQPVPLDQNGCAIVYGVGTYRQIVMDSLGNTVWDQVTTSNGGGGSTGTASSEGVMVGTIIPWANTSLPAQYLYTAGQAVSRTTYSQLLTALTYSTVFLCQSGIATVTVPTNISDGIPIGAPVETSCFAPGTVVSSKTPGTLTLSTNATVSVSVAAVLFPWGNGNGSTTFNVPDLRGRTIAGRDNMNGSIAGILTSTYYLSSGGSGVNPDALNAVAGLQSHTMTIPQLPSGNIGTTAFQFNQTSNGQTGGSQNTVTGIVNSGGGSQLNLVIASNGTSAPFSVVQPSVTSDYIIKALPDDAPTGPGVSSLGGMTGSIACGTNVVCNANTISVSLVPPTTTTLGGVFSKTCSTSNWFNTLDTTGTFGCSQPAFSDLTGTASTAQIANNAVTNAKLATAPATTLKANPTGGTANEQDVTLDSTLGFSGTTIKCTTATTSQIGCSKPDGTTLNIVGGVLSALTGGSGNVTGTGSSIVGNFPAFSNTGATGIVDSGVSPSQIPGVIPSTATVTVSIASPGVITWTGHVLKANATVYLTTTGALPTGLTAATPGTAGPSGAQVVYVVGSSITTNTFQVSATPNGSAINTTGSQSGVHTASANSVACAGCVGEWRYSVVPAPGFGLTSGSPGQVWNTLTLPAGVWKVEAQSGVIHTGSNTPTITHMHSDFNAAGQTTILSAPGQGATTALHITSNDPNGWIFPNGAVVFALTGTTTINAVMTADFTGAPADLAAYGTLKAQRIN